MLHWLGLTVTFISAFVAFHFLGRLFYGFCRGAVAGWRARACKLGHHAKFLERRVEVRQGFDAKLNVPFTRHYAWYRCPYCKERVSDYLPD